MLPSASGGAPKVERSFRTHLTTWERFKQVAHATGRSRSEYVDEMIRREVDEFERAQTT